MLPVHLTLRKLSFAHRFSKLKTCLCGYFGQVYDFLRRGLEWGDAVTELEIQTSVLLANLT